MRLPLAPLLTLLLSLFTVGPIASAQGSLDAMTFNVRYANDGDGPDAWDERQGDVLDLVVYYRPALLGIQEGLYAQVAFLDVGLDDYRYVGVGRDDGARAGEYAALFYDSTRLTLVATETFWLSERPDTVSVGWDAALPRVTTYGAFRHRASGDTVHVFNTHFDHRGERARAESAALIAQRIDAMGLAGARVVVMGDLNSEPGSAPIERFGAYLVDGQTTSTSPAYGPAGTFQAFALDTAVTRRIDYVFVRNLRVTSYRHVDDRRPNNRWPSDHLPVLVEVEWE